MKYIILWIQEGRGVSVQHRRTETYFIRMIVNGTIARHIWHNTILYIVGHELI